MRDSGTVPESAATRVRSVRVGHTPPRQLPERGSAPEPDISSASGTTAAPADDNPDPANRPPEPETVAPVKNFRTQPTPINVSLLEYLLRSHPNQALCHTVTSRFRNGADIGFRGPAQTLILPNNSSALVHAEAVSRAIRAETERGHTCGPFTEPPFPNFRVNPLSARIKTDGSARLILDLSQPDGNAVNEGINPTEYTCSYTSIEEAIELIFKNGGRGALLAKADIKHAFRLIPVRPDQWHLLGYQWNRLFYFDQRISFGCRSSPRIFNDFADCLSWLFSQHAKHHSIRHYLDDFFIVASGEALAARSYDTILNMSRELGVPLAAEKCVPPTTLLVLLGVEIDTERMTISLPADKAAAIISAIRDLIDRNKVTKRHAR